MKKITKASAKRKMLQLIAQVSFYMGLTLLLRFFFGKVSKKEKIIILMYHRIPNIHKSTFNLNIDTISPTPRDFEKQIRYISKYYNAISFDSFIEHVKSKTKLPKNSIIITFDDGYKDCYTNGYPILHKHKIPAMFFLTTNYIDSHELPWWDKITYIIYNTSVPHFTVPKLGTYSLKDSCERAKIIGDIQKKLKKMSEKSKNVIIDELVRILGVELDDRMTENLFLSWEEIKEMTDHGMDFGAHTCSHAILTKVPYEQAEYEIIESKCVIEKQINKNINIFCYPNGLIGDFNESITHILKNQGFAAATSAISGINYLDSRMNLHSLKRMGIGRNTDIYLFMLKSTGILDYVSLWYTKIKEIITHFRLQTFSNLF